LSSLCVWEETPYFSEKERLVLSFTDTLTKLKGSPISQELFDNLSSHFSKKEICYLTLTISQSNTWNRLMKTFGFVPGNHKVSE
jgi:alkylhydroperoxidase family enzyme